MAPLNALFFGRTGHILLYHAVFDDVPRELGCSVHNVRPGVLREQIEWLKDRHDIVTVEEWLGARDPRGLACITFDDAYRSVFQNALPILRDLDVPSTVFVNGCTLEGGVFWRDKIRFVISTGLAEAFADDLCHHEGIQLPAGDLYLASKSASVSSRLVDSALDRFLAAIGKDRALDRLRFCIDDPTELVDDRLVSYGNHTYSHYVLSSLAPDEVREEISRNDTLLRNLGVSLSPVLALPFGGGADCSEAALEAAASCGYAGVLLSRGRLNTVRRTVQGLVVAERYMLPDGVKEHRQLVRRAMGLELRRRARGLFRCGEGLQQD